MPDFAIVSAQTNSKILELLEKFGANKSHLMAREAERRAREFTSSPLSSLSEQGQRETVAKAGNTSTNATDNTTLATTFRIPSNSTQGERDLAYQRQKLDAVTELRILKSADRVRLSHHLTTLEKCHALSSLAMTFADGIRLGLHCIV